MQITPRRGGIALAIFRSSRGRVALVALGLLLAIPATAGAATKYGGWYETNTPLSIRPDTEPVEQALWTSDPVMYIDMPVTKLVTTVTLGDLRNGPYCTTPAKVDVAIQEHSDGQPWSTPVRIVRSTAPVALTGTQQRITWNIPATTLKKGTGYSFKVLTRSGEGCTNVRFTTWRHTNSISVNGGFSNCAPSSTLIRWTRVWHVKDEGLGAGCAGIYELDAGMPTGWLAARPMPYGPGYYIMNKSSPTALGTRPCITGSAGESYGGVWVPWRGDPVNPGYTQYVCQFTQYRAPYARNLEEDFYYAIPWLEGGGVPRDMFLELGTTDYNALLAAHKPLLMYERDEEYFADSAAEMTDASANSLRRQYEPGDLEYGLNPPLGWVTIADNTGNAPDLNLAYLAAKYPPGYMFDTPDNARDQLVVGGDPYTTASAMHEGVYGNHIYGRVAYDSEDRLWLQYWFFYYFNSFEHRNFGPHPGDWEMIQILLTPSLQPDEVTYAQHAYAERCSFAAVSATGNSEHPVVFVADGSHASYTHAGETGITGDAVDHHWGDRLGGAVEPSMEMVSGELHNFWGWPGRWGQDTAINKSPPAPREQGDKWSDPMAFHRDPDNYDCPALRTARRHGRRGRRAAKGIPHTHLTAARLGARIRVRYRVDRRMRRGRGYRLRVVAHTTDPDDMPRSKYIRLRRRKGLVWIRLPRGVPSYSVNASIYDKGGRRGQITTMKVR